MSKKSFQGDNIENKGKKHWVKSTHHLTELWAEGEGGFQADALISGLDSYSNSPNRIHRVNGQCIVYAVYEFKLIMTHIN